MHWIRDVSALLFSSKVLSADWTPVVTSVVDGTLAVANTFALSDVAFSKSAASVFVPAFVISQNEGIDLSSEDTSDVDSDSVHSCGKAIFK